MCLPLSYNFTRPVVMIVRWCLFVITHHKKYIINQLKKLSVFDIIYPTRQKGR